MAPRLQNNHLPVNGNPNHNLANTNSILGNTLNLRNIDNNLGNINNLGSTNDILDNSYNSIGNPNNLVNPQNNVEKPHNNIGNPQIREPPPQGTNGGRQRQRRPRTNYTSRQIELLEEKFKINRYPSIYEREAVANQIQVDESRVQV